MHEREDPPSGEAPAKEFTSRFGISREMTDEEIEDLLTRSWWGSLATVEEGGPYSVPVIYGWDGENFYVAAGAAARSPTSRRTRRCASRSWRPTGSASPGTR